jgi:hypothetical protein
MYLQVIITFRTSYNGMFILENVSVPYNNGFSRKFWLSEVISAFIGITNRNPMLVTGMGYPYPKTCILDVYFPTLAADRMLFLKFVSDDYHLQFSDFPFRYGSNAVFDVYILSAQTSVAGKLIYLECEEYYPSIYSYKRYGIKNVVLNPNNHNVITFSPEEINIDPEESYTGITSVSQIGMHNDYTQSYLFFDNNNNELRLEWDHGNYSQFTVPVLPKLNYDIKIKDVSIGEQDERSEKWIHLQPGENATIIHDPCPTIITPVNNATNITDTTMFFVEDNTGPGIYGFDFLFEIDSSHAFRNFIYTDKKHFMPNELTGINSICLL